MKNTTRTSGKNQKARLKISDLKPAKGGTVKGGGSCAKGKHIKEATITNHNETLVRA